MPSGHPLAELDPLVLAFELNALPLEALGAPQRALFRTTSKFNHACAPNAMVQARKIGVGSGRGRWHCF